MHLVQKVIWAFTNTPSQSKGASMPLLGWLRQATMSADKVF
jgi:hypothetical protein